MQINHDASKGSHHEAATDAPAPSTQITSPTTKPRRCESMFDTDELGAEYAFLFCPARLLELVLTGHSVLGVRRLHSGWMSGFRNTTASLYGYTCKAPCPDPYQDGVLMIPLATENPEEEYDQSPSVENVPEHCRTTETEVREAVIGSWRIPV